MWMKGIFFLLMVACLFMEMSKSRINAFQMLIPRYMKKTHHRVVRNRSITPVFDKPKNRHNRMSHIQYDTVNMNEEETIQDTNDEGDYIANDKGWTLQSMVFKELNLNDIDSDLLSDFLMELGAYSVSITDHDLDSEQESPIFREPSTNTLLTSSTNNLNDGTPLVSAAPFLPQDFISTSSTSKDPNKNDNNNNKLWNRSDVTAHFPSSTNFPDIADMVRYTFNLSQTPRFQIDDIPDIDWITHVQSSWKPIVISNLFVLRFPWHDEQDLISVLSETASKEENKSNNIILDNYIQLQLEGGIAFGTGEHPTTQLCLEWIHQIFHHLDRQHQDIKNQEPIMFLDYGSGSGILGMAACALSSHYNRMNTNNNNNRTFQAVGIEIDIDAIQIANYNSHTNNCNMKSYLPSSLGLDDESASIIMKALVKRQQQDSSPYKNVEILPESLSCPNLLYDAAVANILAGPLISLSETIAGMIKPGGYLGLSGILSYQGEEVKEAYSKYFDNVTIEKEKGGWLLITGIRKY
jgi:ribosomal protein L11 methyltransferase